MAKFYVKVSKEKWVNPHSYRQLWAALLEKGFMLEKEVGEDVFYSIPANCMETHMQEALLKMSYGIDPKMPGPLLATANPFLGVPVIWSNMSTRA